jgi:hypothetical protein
MPTRAVKKRFSLPATNRMYAFSISNTSSGDTDSSDSDAKYFPHDPVNGYNVASKKLKAWVVVREPHTPPGQFVIGAPFG